MQFCKGFKAPAAPNRKAFGFKFTHVISRTPLWILFQFLHTWLGALVPVTRWVCCWPAVNRSPQTNRERVNRIFFSKENLDRWLHYMATVTRETSSQQAYSLAG